MRRYVAVGGICGLAWSAALRGWMVQLAGGGSTFTWMTFVLVLLPGVVVGMLLGWAAYLRSTGVAPPRKLILAPVVFASALFDPVIFIGLIREGTGGGALMVIATAMSAGFVLSRKGFSWGRAACALVATLGLLMLFGMGGMAAPISSPRGAWTSLFGLCLILVLCLASALPYPTSARVPLPVVGGLCGLAWACALRSFMTTVAGPESEIHWVGTFAFILLPGLVAGALLGWGRRWTVWSPMLFASVLLSDPLDIGSLLDDGVGGGAIGVPLLGIIGGYAAAGRGTVTKRAVAGGFFVAGLVVWAVTATAVGGPSFSLTTTHGLWASLLYWSLLITLALGASVPLRSSSTIAAAKQSRPSGPTGGACSSTTDDSTSRIGAAGGAPA
ncbi:hypothetical protein AB0M20_06450 [Actinoplanes sp. NPDC051633]|uniref:hypothetical protein n=1 Tax=Actinoplanes sp. NPDC051633 TaxID=3155670 RepID=UPI0034410DAB